MSEKNSILKGDGYLWGVYIVLCIVSIIEMFSSTSYLIRNSQNFMWPVMRQIAFVVAGISVVTIMHNFHYKWVKLIMILLFPITTILLIITLFVGRWLGGEGLGFTLQPSELAKLCMIITCAFILAKYQDKERGGASTEAFKWCLIVTGGLCVVIAVGNLSTALLMGLVCFCMMMIARVESKKLLMLFSIAAAAVAILLTVSVAVYKYEEKTGEQVWLLGDKLRLEVWGERCVNFFSNDTPPCKQPITDENRQVQHAYMAVANSGGVGVLPGNSRGRDFLPEAYSDYMYAIIIEEWGIVGAIFIMGIYLSLLLRAGIIARRCEKAYPAFLITGLAMMIGFQALVNMGVSVGLFPVTGQPLPLISRGGTAFLVMSSYFGIMLSVSRFAKQVGKDDAKELVEADAVDLSAPNPVQK